MNKNAIVMGLLFLVVFIAGFGLGRLSDGASTAEMVRNTQNSLSGQQEDTTTTGDNPAAAEGTTVNTNNLSDGQKAMLQAMGIDPNNFTITAEMVACAEAKLGAPRVEEIKNGATPSFSEGATLMACYR